ncbi:MAG: septum formation initiator family protein [Flavobacteriales bacterium]|nr:septum formation initiator family protein [Flavobacteriales bacterium]
MDKLKEIGLAVYPYVRNKYIMTVVVFLVWMTFFDENNFISLVENRMKLAELEDEKEHYVDEINESAEDLKLLQNDKELLEKFARERYLMKKENEEIFVFATEEE